MDLRLSSWQPYWLMRGGLGPAPQPRGHLLGHNAAPWSPLAPAWTHRPRGCGVRWGQQGHRSGTPSIGALDPCGVSDRPRASVSPGTASLVWRPQVQAWGDSGFADLTGRVQRDGEWGAGPGRSAPKQEVDRACIRKCGTICPPPWLWAGTITASKRFHHLGSARHLSFKPHRSLSLLSSTLTGAPSGDSSVRTVGRHGASGTFHQHSPGWALFLLLEHSVPGCFQTLHHCF